MGPTTRNKRRPRHVPQLPHADLWGGQDDELLSLPKEVLDIIAAGLSQQDISTASLVCKKWVKLLRSGVADLTTVARVFTDDPFTFEAFSLHSIVPKLRQLNLYLTPRSSQEALSRYLGHLDAFQHLQRLELTFWVPLEPKRGLFPVFFAECLKAPQQLQALRLDGCPLPDVAMQALTKMEQPFSQLSELIFEPNSYPGGRVAASHDHSRWDTIGSSMTGQLPNCAALPILAPNLRRLHTQPPADATSDWAEGLAGLKRLTALQLETQAGYHNPCPHAALQAVCSSAGQQLEELGVNLAPGSLEALKPGGALLGLPRLQQLDLKLWMWTPSAVSAALSGLASHPSGPEVLQSLGIFPCLCSNVLLEDIGRCTGLRKLQLQHLVEAPAGGAAAAGGGPGAAAAGGGGGAASSAAQAGLLDLAPLSRLAHLEELVVTQAAEASRIRWPMVLGSYWPRLRSLELASSSLTPAALGPLSQWPALTRLQLSTRPVRDLPMGLLLAAQEGEGGSGGEAVLHLEDLGRGLSHLELEGYTLLLNRGRRATSLHQLKHLSLTRCSVVSCVGRRMSRHQQPTHDLPLLLSRTPHLTLLHLSGVPGLCDCDFGAIGALTRLTTLSIQAVGNPDVTQGAMVSLAGLQGLRVLRWHVGDNADASLPHLPTLQGFQQLLSFHVTPQMDRMLERWCAYDIFDHMRSADVVVEWVNT